MTSPFDGFLARLFEENPEIDPSLFPPVSADKPQPFDLDLIAERSGYRIPIYLNENDEMPALDVETDSRPIAFAQVVDGDLTLGYHPDNEELVLAQIPDHWRPVILSDDEWSEKYLAWVVGYHREWEKSGKKLQPSIYVIYLDGEPPEEFADELDED